MAIDADLNAGIIDQEIALRRREEVAQESDFSDPWMARLNLLGGMPLLDY